MTDIVELAREQREKAAQGVVDLLCHCFWGRDAKEYLRRLHDNLRDVADFASLGDIPKPKIMPPAGLGYWVNEERHEPAS